MMRGSVVLALAAAFVAVPAFAGGVQFSLQGTTDAVATRDITVGPDIAGGIFLVTDTVSDVGLTTGLSDMITLDPSGGDVSVFLYAAADGPGDGLMSFVADMTSSMGGVTFSEFNFDTVFQDAPGRTALFAGLPSAIPEERRMSGPLTSADSGLFQQSWTSSFAASTGLAGGSLTDVGAGSSALDAVSDAHTFNIGQVGNDQSAGATALGRFTVSIPAVPGTYVISADAQSLLTYVDGPVFPGAGNPPNPSAIVEAGDLTGSDSLTIVVTPEPASILLVLPAVALLRRRR